MQSLFQESPPIICDKLNVLEIIAMKLEIDFVVRPFRMELL